ncbi:MAG: hypothetical protein DWQ06_03925 [Calditrichaeota bacterium]|nr:MAG: hypothetical protein DWQ06_03925 [Calditrichota bacterium]
MPTKHTKKKRAKAKRIAGFSLLSGKKRTKVRNPKFANFLKKQRILIMKDTENTKREKGKIEKRESEVATRLTSDSWFLTLEIFKTISH